MLNFVPAQEDKWWIKGKATCIFILSLCRSSDLWPDYLQGKLPYSHQRGGPVGPKTSFDAADSRETLRPEGRFRIYGRALYQLSCRGTYTALRNLHGVYIEKNQPKMGCSKRRRRRRHSSDCAINTNSQSLPNALVVKQVSINNAGNVRCKKKIPTKFAIQFSHIFVTVVHSRELTFRRLTWSIVDVPHR